MEHEPITIREALTGHVHRRTQQTNLQTIPEYPHIEFENLDHYREALAFAEKQGSKTLQSLKESLSALDRWADKDKETCQVFPDCAKHSFYFRFYTESGRCSLNGGVILHGLGATSTVELCPKEGVYWSIHT